MKYFEKVAEPLRERDLKSQRLDYFKRIGFVNDLRSNNEDFLKEKITGTFKDTLTGRDVKRLRLKLITQRKYPEMVLDHGTNKFYRGNALINARSSKANEIEFKKYENNFGDHKQRWVNEAKDAHASMKKNRKNIKSYEDLVRKAVKGRNKARALVGGVVGLGALGAGAYGISKK